MNKFKIWAAAVICLSIVCSNAPQAEAGVNRAGRKFARGVAHFISAPVFIPKEIIQTTVEAEPVYIAPWKGLTAGAGRGAFLMGRQWVSACTDMFTFWKPGGPLFEPESLFPEI